MPVRVAMLSVGHVHAPSYVRCLSELTGAELVGHWDKDAGLAESFARHGSRAWSDRDALLAECEAVVIAGENLEHAELIELAAGAGKSILCEKPLAASPQERSRIEKAVIDSGVLLMTAFPCPFSPSFESAQQKIANGAIGKVLSVCATNHGKCPGGWFTDPTKSGGGAMIDHTVHVADLLRRLLREEPARIYAATGNGMYAQVWEDTAMVTIDFPSGVFATLDASWSRPKSFRNWGDVTMKIVGEKGVIELDLFGQGIDVYTDADNHHALMGFGSNLDMAMVSEFLSAHVERREPKVTMLDGLAAADLAIAAYQSADSGQPVAIKAS